MQKIINAIRSHYWGVITGIAIGSLLTFVTTSCMEWLEVFDINIEQAKWTVQKLESVYKIVDGFQKISGLLAFIFGLPALLRAWLISKTGRRYAIRRRK